MSAIGKGELLIRKLRNATVLEPRRRLRALSVLQLTAATVSQAKQSQSSRVEAKAHTVRERGDEPSISLPASEPECE